MRDHDDFDALWRDHQRRKRTRAGLAGIGLGLIGSVCWPETRRLWSEPWQTLAIVFGVLTVACWAYWLLLPKLLADTRERELNLEELVVLSLGLIENPITCRRALEAADAPLFRGFFASRRFRSALCTLTARGFLEPVFDLGMRLTEAGERELAKRNVRLVGDELRIG